MGARRSSLAPEPPTLAETGLPGFEASSWLALLAPAGTPAAIVQRINFELNEVLRAPDTMHQFQAAGLVRREAQLTHRRQCFQSPGAGATSRQHRSRRPASTPHHVCAISRSTAWTARRHALEQALLVAIEAAPAGAVGPG